MEKKPKSLHNILLAVILLGALLIRVIGIFPGHPADHPDEPMSYGSALEMVVHGDLNPRRFDYPAGVPLIHYLFFKALPLPIAYLKVIFLHPRLLGAAVALGQEQFMNEYTVALFGKNGITFLYWSRLLTAMLGTASVYVVYLIGKKLFNTLTGLIAALFLAGNYRHVLSSHLALSDIPNGFFALLAFYSAALLLEKNTRKRYLLCGLCVGLSIAMKYQLFALLPFVFVHAMWVFRKRKLRELIHPYFILGLVLVGVIFVVVNPYFFVNWQKTLEATAIVSRRYGAGSFRFNFYPLFYLYHWGIDKLPFLSIASGFIIAALLAPLKTFFLLTYLGPFLYIFLYFMTGGTYIRNFVTGIPFFMLFTAYPFGLLHRTARRRAVAVSIAIVIVVINAKPFINSLILDASYLAPWTRDTLTAWVLLHIPEHSRILNDNVGVPSSIEKPLQITPWGYEEGNAITELMDNGYDFAVLNTAWNQIYFFWFDSAWKQFFVGQNIPYGQLRDSYRGLLLSEYLRYTVAEFYKPWQAPENSYLVLKIPQAPTSLGSMKTSHTIGNETKHWVSSNVAVVAGKLYTAEGYIKASTQIPSNLRDGFFRMDFYDVASRTLQTSLSGRVHGPSQWVKRRVVAVAPQRATHLTISFERENPDIGYWVDAVKVYESEKGFVDNFPTIPYIRTTIPPMTVFPNSIY